jgi:hypothetical protein
MLVAEPIILACHSQTHLKEFFGSVKEPTPSSKITCPRHMILDIAEHA